MYTVLVADDQERICNGLAGLIGQFLDLKLIGAYRNGTDVLNAIKRQTPDILITDIHMPGADGLEICQCVRAHSDATQIILISGYKKFEYARDAIRYNVRSYLVKPYALELLLDAIRDAVRILNARQTHARSLTEVYFIKRERAKSCLTRVFSGQGGEDAMGECPVLAQTTPAKACRVTEITLDGGAGLQELEFDSFRLSSFLADDRTLVLFYKDVADKKNYIADCEKGEKMAGRTLRFRALPDMTFAEWTTFCKIRRLALLFVQALKNMDVNGFISQYRKELQGISQPEEFFRIAADQIGSQPLRDFTACSTDGIENNLLAFYDVYLSDSGNMLANICNYIKQSLSSPQLSVENIADHFKISRSYISGWFVKKTGETLTDYINTVRIEKAQKLLIEQPNLTHEAIARAVGYNSLSYFYRIFKKRLHITPLQFQKKVK